MTSRTVAEAEETAGSIVPGTAWTDVGLAVAAAYQYRMTSAPDIVLTAQGQEARLTVRPSMTLPDLVSELRRQLPQDGGDRFAAADADGTAVPVRVASPGSAEGDLTVTIACPEQAGRPRIAIADEAKRLSAAQLAAHGQRLRCFADRLADAGPGARIGDIDLLTPAERHRIFHEWNGADRDVPALTLPELVEASVSARPGQPAVSHHGERLTYGDLDARANRLARVLMAAGAGAGDIVAMVLPRSVDYVVAALAIVKTGAAYLPVDTSYPAERINQMLADSQASHIVTVSALAGIVDGPAPVLVIDDERVRARLAAASPDRPSDRDRRAPVSLDSAAYVLYTSGSTGRPKGVVVSHRAITNRLHHMQHEIPLGPGDRLLQKTPAGFDVTVREVFWPLLAGASIVVADPDGHRDPVYLAETIAAESITIAHFVPSGLKVFLDEPEAAKCGSLRRVVCGGEALPAELQARFASVLEADLFNVYGPTEAAVDVTSMLCPRNPEPGPVLIGRPVWNTKIYILDGQRRQLPPGVIGELYIAGTQLAMGYLNQPELTRDRFVPDPFGEPGSRMYRSGDAARWRADGVIEFFGRLDHQVKIRGFRVELGEIESVLLRDAAVRQAACVVREDVPGDQRLVAYVVPAGGGSPDLDALRTTVARALPDYMVPSAFVTLDSFPLTPNEKLDRKALPKPEAALPRTGRRPNTPAEHLVAELFGALLEVPEVGADDEFFALGGNSLLASQLAKQIRERSGIRVRLKTILEDSSVGAIAQLLEPVKAPGETG